MLQVVLFRKSALVSCVFVVGCGASTSLPPTDQYDARFNQYSAIDAQNTSANFTPENAMPSSGSVTYDGVGFVYYKVNGQETDLLGDASIRANFGTDTMSGTVKNFVGGPVVGTGVDDITAYTGNLAMTGEVGTTAAGCNACFAGQVSGTLIGSGDTIRIDSTLLGDFFGAGHESITGFTPNSNTVLVNGVVSTGGAVVVAER